MKKTLTDINIATNTIVGLIAHTNEGWLDLMAQYQGERTPAAVGEVVHKALQIADKVNHTNHERLFLNCLWYNVGFYLLQLEEDEQPTA